MTIRTEAELNALYADNTTGEIGAGDLRDLVDTLFQPRTIKVHGHQFSRSTGATRPVETFYGPSEVLEFDVGDEAWFHFTFPNGFDAAQDLTIQIDWAPSGAEIAKTVSWDVDYLVMGNGSLINTAEGTLQAVDDAVPTAQYQDTTSTLTIPAAALDATDHELKIRVERVASGADPVNPPAVHHVYASVVTQWPGAS